MFIECFIYLTTEGTFVCPTDNKVVSCMHCIVLYCASNEVTPWNEKKQRTLI